MTATRGCGGAIGRRRMELDDEVSDLNGGGVASPGGSARSRLVSPAGDIMPCRSDEVARASLVFLMPKFWPWRSLAAYCGVRGDMRSIAPIMLIMVGRSLATFGGVPGVRPNRAGSLVGLGWLARTSGPQRRPPERRD